MPNVIPWTARKEEGQEGRILPQIKKIIIIIFLKNECGSEQNL